MCVAMCDGSAGGRSVDRLRGEGGIAGGGGGAGGVCEGGGGADGGAGGDHAAAEDSQCGRGGMEDRAGDVRAACGDGGGAGAGAAQEPLVAGITTTLVGIVFLAIASAQLFAGRSMQTLNPSGKILAVVVSAIGLLGFPCGTIISGYLLYLLLSAKGEMVFSSAYKEVMQATPHIRYRTSIIVWIFLFILIGVILLGVLAAIFGAR